MSDPISSPILTSRSNARRKVSLLTRLVPAALLFLNALLIQAPSRASAEELPVNGLCTEFGVGGLQFKSTGEGAAVDYTVVDSTQIFFGIAFDSSDPNYEPYFNVNFFTIPAPISSNLHCTSSSNADRYSPDAYICAVVDPEFVIQDGWFDEDGWVSFVGGSMSDVTIQDSDSSTTFFWLDRVSFANFTAVNIGGSGGLTVGVLPADLLARFDDEDNLTMSQSEADQLCTQAPIETPPNRSRPDLSQLLERSALPDTR